MTEPHQLKIPDPAAGPRGETHDVTGYAVTCPTHGQVHITPAEYFAQLKREGQRWACPRNVHRGDHTVGPCGEPSDFDDELFDRTFDHEFDDPEATPTNV